MEVSDLKCDHTKITGWIIIVNFGALRCYLLTSDVCSGIRAQYMQADLQNSSHNNSKFSAIIMRSLHVNYLSSPVTHVHVQCHVLEGIPAIVIYTCTCSLSTHNKYKNTNVQVQ